MVAEAMVSRYCLRGRLKLLNPRQTLDALQIRSIDLMLSNPVFQRIEIATPMLPRWKKDYQFIHPVFSSLYPKILILTR